MNNDEQKATGSYFTPESVAKSLVQWAVRSPKDRLLDPACGDGRFLSLHRPSVGVEQTSEVAALAVERAPWALVHEGDFFRWASQTVERFECAAGNPPFIRYQRFTGTVREAALEICAKHGASFTALASSWAPFLVATCSLLKPGGRIAFVVPAEIGHAPYAVPLVQYLINHFDRVQIVAVREKLFPDLSEDCWLLYADGFGGSTNCIKFTALEKFEFSECPPSKTLSIGIVEWNYWNNRLRPFLISAEARTLYHSIASSTTCQRLGDIARVGIGYVSGDNSFFHLRPSLAKRLDIPRRFLHPTVRNARYLGMDAVTPALVRSWLKNDDPVLLLRIKRRDDIPESVVRYLNTPEGRQAQTGYKCRMRNPWFAVPDVTVPDAFLSYMSGHDSTLVANDAKCACTNSIHAIKLKGPISTTQLRKIWARPLTHLSCELEGHPLGGGMLKLEPREAARVILAPRFLPSTADLSTVQEALVEMRRWRHYG